MFNTNENRIGAFAGFVALVLVLALTAMAFTALEPGQRVARGTEWDVSLPETPQTHVLPSFGS
ncbi:MAG: hypothetical protein R3C30_14635 [Hyphomonadaceae bacterium]